MNPPHAGSWLALLGCTFALVSGCGDDAGVADNSAAVGGAGASGAASSGGSAGVAAGGGAGGSGGLPVDSGSDASSSADLCSAPSGTFFALGDFESGMDGDVPKGWELRDKNAPANCAGSGSAAEHVFLTSPAPGCAGKALAMDARGQWDCYAIQRVSDYNTIVGGKTYRVSASVRSTGNADNPAAWFIVGVQWLDASDGFFGDEKNPKTVAASDNDFDWKQLSFDLVAPQNARRILVWLSAHYPGRVDIDNVSVRAL
jgi:hypothetical protein